jgi:uncharacterized protein
LLQNVHRWQQIEAAAKFEAMKEFIAYLVKNLVSQPASVDIQVVEGALGTLVEIRVAKEDIARIVGREGRNIKALRTLSTSVGARFGRKILLEVITETNPSEQQPAQVEEQPAQVEEQPAQVEQQPAQVEQQPAQVE